MSINGLNYVEQVIEKCESLLSTLDEMGKSPNNKKILDKRFSVNEAAELVGRSRVSLNRAEKEGVISPDKDPKSKRILGYTLDEVNALRTHFGKTRHRKNSDPCLKVAIQSFKGGVAKSVTSIHLAQYLAIHGYRVLLVDCDPQASSTSSFGYLPDRVFTEKDTLLPFMQGKEEDLQYCIRETYFPGIHIIPSCLPFYDAEFQLAFAASEAESPEERLGYYSEFVDAFATIEDYYDFILIDSPPALGMITINILASADALIVPTPPALYDFSSTIQYFKMIRKIMRSVIPSKEYQFIKILATRVDTRKNMHMDMLELMREVFGQSIFKSVFLQTAEIENAAAEFKTVYDLAKPNKRAVNILNQVFREIEIELLKSWPSYQKKLVEEGVI